MILNVVFDLGNVLISFRPAEYLKENHCPEELRETIITDIFSSPEWLMLDRGIIKKEEAIESIAAKSALKREEISRVFDIRTKIMFPLDDNVRLLPELKKQGFRLFYLSNFPKDIFYEVKNSFAFFRYFDGGIISAEVNYLKPEPEIFRIFLERFHLDPYETFFIDDTETNIMTAESLGIKSFLTRGSTDISEIGFSLKKILSLA